MELHRGKSGNRKHSEYFRKSVSQSNLPALDPDTIFNSGSLGRTAHCHFNLLPRHLSGCNLRTFQDAQDRQLASLLASNLLGDLAQRRAYILLEQYADACACLAVDRNLCCAGLPSEIHQKNPAAMKCGSRLTAHAC